jgi:hypothetical protein
MMGEPPSKGLTGTGRRELLELIDQQAARLEKLKHDHDAMLENLTLTQARCTELLLENRELRGVSAEAEHCYCCGKTDAELAPHQLRLWCGRSNCT